MKFAKILIPILVVVLIIGVFVFCGKKYEELPLTRSEITIHKNTSLEIKGVIDYENSDISETDTVSVSSTSENIAKFENNKIVFGNEYGKATLEIVVGNKKGTVSVNVVPYKDYLYSLAQADGASGYDKLTYFATTWLINNLGTFKNPSSVSVEDIFYVKGDVDSNKFNGNYLIMEIRAQKGFGGYGVDYYKVSAGSLQVVDVDTVGFMHSYNGKDLSSWSFGAYYVNAAIREYIAENY